MSNRTIALGHGMNALAFPQLQHLSKSLGDGCGVEGKGFVATASHCSETVSPIDGSVASSSCSFEEHFVLADVVVDLNSYLDEVETILLQGLQLGALQRSALANLRLPKNCTLCVKPQCLGDDVALRAFLLAFYAWIPPDVPAGMPAFLPHHFNWTRVNASHLPLTEAAFARVVDPVVTAVANPLPLRVAVFTQYSAATLGGGTTHWARHTNPHMSTLFDEIFHFALYRLPYEKLHELWRAGDLIEQWWNNASPQLGWFFGWQADALLVHARKSIRAEISKWIAEHYDILVFLNLRDVTLLTHQHGQGPVRILMPIEPYMVFNWVLGDASEDEPQIVPGLIPRQKRLWSFFKQHGVCPVVLDHYGLQWVVKQNSFRRSHGQFYFDRRFAIHERHGASPIASMKELAPLVLAPQMHRWHLPLYRPWRISADSLAQLQFAQAGSLGARERLMDRFRGIVLVDRKELHDGTGIAAVAKLQDELRQRGFGITFSDFGKRRHRNDVHKQPRAVAHSLFHNHMPELVNCKYVIAVDAKPSAGQLVAEASFLGVLAIAPPDKMFARLLLPPQLHATSLPAALAVIDMLEASPQQAIVLRSLIKGRAERLVGAEDAPPVKSYLRLLAKVPVLGMSAASMASLCSPPNATDLELPREGFWRIAAGHACGVGSTEVSFGAQHQHLSTARCCATACRRVGGKAFTYDDVSRSCRTFTHCKVTLPDSWTTDVYVLEPLTDDVAPVISFL